MGNFADSESRVLPGTGGEMVVILACVLLIDQQDVRDRQTGTFAIAIPDVCIAS